MTIYHHPLCIDCAGGIMEDVPAEWSIDEDAGAVLVGFMIGGFIGDRDTAIAMTGRAHVIRQEELVMERWDEDAGDRSAAAQEAYYDALDGR